ncbi:unnamed protein product [Closterium sp. Naga37s-1]|nr:unnamed protein product [Closterium sp. Naga37s-1]
MPPCRSAPVQRCPRAEVPTCRGAHVQRCRTLLSQQTCRQQPLATRQSRSRSFSPAFPVRTTALVTRTPPRVHPRVSSHCSSTLYPEAVATAETRVSHLSLSYFLLTTCKEKGIGWVSPVAALLSQQTCRQQPLATRQSRSRSFSPAFPVRTTALVTRTPPRVHPRVSSHCSSTLYPEAVATAETRASHTCRFHTSFSRPAKKRGLGGCLPLQPAVVPADVQTAATRHSIPLALASDRFSVHTHSSPARPNTCILTHLPIRSRSHPTACPSAHPLATRTPPRVHPQASSRCSREDGRHTCVPLSRRSPSTDRTVTSTAFSKDDLQEKRGCQANGRHTRVPLSHRWTSMDRASYFLRTSFSRPARKRGYGGCLSLQPAVVPADVQTADTHARALPCANLPPLTSRSLVPCTAFHHFRLRSRPPANARVLPPTPTVDPADVQKADARHSIPFLAPLVRSSSLSVLSKRLCVFVSSSCKKGGVRVSRVAA